MKRKDKAFEFLQPFLNEAAQWLQPQRPQQPSPLAHTRVRPSPSEERRRPSSTGGSGSPKVQRRPSAESQLAQLMRVVPGCSALEAAQ